jgi:hypothetical protein
MQPFQRHIKINSDHMRYLYQKDERALPGNLQNQKYSFLHPPKCTVSHYLPPPSISLFLQVEGVSNLRPSNMVTSPVGLGTENDCAGEGQQQL